MNKTIGLMVNWLNQQSVKLSSFDYVGSIPTSPTNSSKAQVDGLPPFKRKDVGSKPTGGTKVIEI